MKTLNFAIIGFGKMGKIRYQALQKIPGCQVTCCFEPCLQGELPPEVENVTDPKSIFTRKDVDAVIVCTPNYLLKDFVVQAFKHDKHVFCEKPPGRNMGELKAMIAAQKKSKHRKLMFGFNHRHHESILQAKKAVDSGEYGRIIWMRGRYGKSVDKNFFSGWRAKKELAGAGIFLDQGIHMVDLFLMFCDDFDQVKAVVSNLYWKLDIEDNVFAIFKNKKGQAASLHSTMTQWRHLFSLEIFLERGYIVINGLKTSSNTYGDEILTIAKNRTPPPEASWTEEDSVKFHTDESWERELNIFVDAIRAGKEVPVGGPKDALKLMRLVEKVYAQK